MNHLYEIATGRLISSSRLDIVPLAGFAVITLPDGDEVGVWNPSTLSFDARPIKRMIDKVDFLYRLTETELAAITTAAKTDVSVEVFMQLFNAATRLDLNSERLQIAFAAFEQMGIISTGRSAEILNG